MITVKVVAPFDFKKVSPSGEVQVPEGTTLAGLLRRGGAPLLAFVWPVAVNGTQQSKSYRMQDGDLVVFIAPFSGG